MRRDEACECDSEHKAHDKTTERHSATDCDLREDIARVVLTVDRSRGTRRAVRVRGGRGVDEFAVASACATRAGADRAVVEEQVSVPVLFRALYEYVSGRQE